MKFLDYRTFAHMMSLYIETSRTFMRPLEVEDAECFFQLNADPEVLRFTGDEPFSSCNAARDFLARYKPYEKFGTGRLAVIHRSSLEFLGWCGLKFTPESGEYDIGFRFFQRFWNQGYASETASANLNFGFEKLQVPRIIGRVQQDNLASIRVLEKIGLSRVGELPFDGKKGWLYHIEKDTR